MVPDFIRKEVTIFSIVFGAIGLFVGNRLNVAGHLEWNIGTVLLFIVAGVFCYAVNKFVAFKLGPYKWMPWATLLLTSAFAYFVL